MMLVRGAFSTLLVSDIDVCSRPRHFFAKLGLCKHKTVNIQKSLKQAMQEAYTARYEEMAKQVLDKPFTKPK